MPISSFIVPWSGYAVRHLPEPKKGQTFDPLDFTWCGKSSENRWNTLGEPTLYLAQEKDVALAEYARHFQIDRSPGLAKKTQRRKVYRFKIELSYTLDLRNRALCKALSLTKFPGCFADKKIARSTATFLRNTTSVQAIFVPSIAFLDDPDKWCLVVFLEKLEPNTKTFFKNCRTDGYFRIS
ncbi:MAG: RES family NAD+ phosphorylase [Candidatus Riflebacteria bacterium]|nr:RES family NAD+ phosphorylase [Candidatus Riflebacteria bacterium]